MPKIINHRTIGEMIMIAASIMAAVTLIPFSIYRFGQNQYAIAILELIVVLVMAVNGLLVWKKIHTEVAGLILSCFVFGGIVGLSYMIGTTIIFWIYPIIITAYFVNNAKISAVLIITCLLALLPLLVFEKNPIELANILVTIAVTTIFSHLISSKIRQQHNHLQTLVNHDGLTGALNRRSLDDRLDLLQNLYFRHKRTGGNITSVILFEIDEYQAIYNKYGHREGDQILIKLTQKINGYIRKTDEFYRYDNEKFVLIGNGAGLLKASELAEKIRKLIESASLSDETAVTASFGVAEVQNLESSNKWIDRAENALDRAKRAGNNRVYLANSDRNEEPVARIYAL